MWSLGQRVRLQNGARLHVRVTTLSRTVGPPNRNGYLVSPAGNFKGGLAVVYVVVLLNSNKDIKEITFTFLSYSVHICACNDTFSLMLGGTKITKTMHTTHNGEGIFWRSDRACNTFLIEAEERDNIRQRNFEKINSLSRSWTTGWVFLNVYKHLRINLDLLTNSIWTNVMSMPKRYCCYYCYVTITAQWSHVSGMQRVIKYALSLTSCDKELP